MHNFIIKLTYISNKLTIWIGTTPGKFLTTGGELPGTMLECNELMLVGKEPIGTAGCKVWSKEPSAWFRNTLIASSNLSSITTGF